MGEVRWKPVYLEKEGFSRGRFAISLENIVCFLRAGDEQASGAPTEAQLAEGASGDVIEGGPVEDFMVLDTRIELRVVGREVADSKELGHRPGKG